MIDWKNMWVGDELWDIEQNRIVKFKSKKGSVITVSHGEHHYIKSADQLRLATSSEIDSTDTEEETIEPSNSKPSENPGKVIDLHLEQLPKHIQQANPTRLLDLKIDYCKKYIAKARVHHHKIITIIHGKGTGILKTEVENLLKHTDGVRFTFPTQDGGATEVWFD